MAIPTGITVLYPSEWKINQCLDPSNMPHSKIYHKILSLPSIVICSSLLFKNKLQDFVKYISAYFGFKTLNTILNTEPRLRKIVQEILELGSSIASAVHLILFMS